MAKIDHATITLKGGDWIEAYIPIEGELVKVTIRAEESPASDTPRAGDPPFHWSGTGGQTALTLRFVNGAELDVVQALQAVAAEDHHRLGGDYEVERGDVWNPRLGWVRAVTPTTSEFDIVLSDVGDL